MSELSQPRGYTLGRSTILTFLLSFPHRKALISPLFTSQILDTGPPNEGKLLKREKKVKKREQKGDDKQ